MKMPDRIAILGKLPNCQICEKHGFEVEAAYDANLGDPFNRWAYVCNLCFAVFGKGLGIGRGQKIKELAYVKAIIWTPNWKEWQFKLNDLQYWVVEQNSMLNL